MKHENIAIVAYTDKKTKALGAMRIVQNNATDITRIVTFMQNELLHQVASQKLRLDKEKAENANPEIIAFLEENIAYQEQLNISSFGLIQGGLELLKEYKVEHLDINSLKELVKKYEEANQTGSEPVDKENNNELSSNAKQSSEGNEKC